jgi:hypothetical protein
MKPTAEELKIILDLHAKWLRSDSDGKRANLSDADLRNADLRNADLRNADLSGADLSGADLRNADLSGADLIRADLRNADLSGADLGGANLIRADLIRADLSGANLSGAIFNYPVTKMIDVKDRVLGRIAEGCSVNMREWHTCETTHCLAGWIVTVHPEGRLLEHVTSTHLAAHLILHAAGIESPNFFDTRPGCDERAVNWLKTGQQIDTPEVATTEGGAS